MNFETLEIEEKNGTGFIYFKREDKLNTLTVQMVDEILQALNDMENHCKSVIVGGKDNFSAGADVFQFSNIAPEEAYEFHRKLNKLALYFREYPRPVISFLNGYVLGGGLEISLSTDIRICSRSAVLGQPEIALGINAGAGGNVILPSITGRNRALYMILTGEKISAKTAYEFGLVDILADNAVGKAIETAELINSMPEKAVTLAKRAVNNSANNDIVKNLDYEAALFGILFSEKETKDRINNFIDRKIK
ncbi:enoyl-CoA hydratase/isomerase family protein [Ferroplasma sp.]|uniref:enoyl-CoA hydratase/isomerase family protein n=1 Tax=Ferroplasma sp. TaxID=2591003 RepID=UPI00307CCC26